MRYPLLPTRQLFHHLQQVPPGRETQVFSLNSEKGRADFVHHLLPVLPSPSLVLCPRSQP